MLALMVGLTLRPGSGFFHCGLEADLTMRDFIRKASLVTVAAAMLFGRYWISRPGPSDAAAASSPAMDQTQIIASDDVVTGRDQLELDRLPHFTHRVRDHVQLSARSAKVGNLMVHGYTATGVGVNAVCQAKVRFVASWPGRYMLHLHKDSGEQREAAVVDVTQ